MAAYEAHENSHMGVQAGIGKCQGYWQCGTPLELFDFLLKNTLFVCGMLSRADMLDFDNKVVCRAESPDNALSSSPELIPEVERRPAFVKNLLHSKSPPKSYHHRFAHRSFPTSKIVPNSLPLKPYQKRSGVLLQVDR